MICRILAFNNLVIIQSKMSNSSADLKNFTRLDNYSHSS